MAKKAEKSDIVAGNPLATISVERMIRVVRDKQVLLDRDIAMLYGVETRAINQAVKRNIDRFPERYCFQLAKDELDNLKSQNVISSWGGDRFRPYVFTEQGFAMLSSVLKSKVAVNVSIAIMDAFVAMRQYLYQCGGIVNRLVQVESKETEQDRRLLEHDRKIDSLFEAMDRRETDLQKVMENFIDPSTYKHFLILNGHKLEADVAYAQIYGLAKKSLTIVDNYIDVKTLNLLRNVPKGVSVRIFSDLHGSSRLTDDMLADYRSARPDVSIDRKPAMHRFHDRYIFVDFKEKGEKLFHCGASSKDAGNKITTIYNWKISKDIAQCLKNCGNNWMHDMASKIIGIACESQNVEFKSSWHDEYLKWVLVIKAALGTLYLFPGFQQRIWTGVR